MDATLVLASIASLFPSLPDESVEHQLVTFDTLVNVSGAAHRPAAAELLRAAAASSENPSRRDRLLKAADAVAAGEPCAFTPRGLSAAEAAASQTMTREQWEAHVAEHPLPPPPSATNEEDEEEDDDDDDDDEDEDAVPADHMEAEPPKLPHLPVRHFFPGLVIRAAQDFVDAQGRAVSAGELLTLLALERTEGVCYVLNLLVRTVRLDAGSSALIENAANAWFQPVPSIDCLYELWHAIDLALSDAADEAEDDDDDDDRLDTISSDVESCEAWLTHPGKRGPAPECRSAPLAARIFGRDHHLTAWIRLLFAAVAVALPETQ